MRRLRRILFALLLSPVAAATAQDELVLNTGVRAPYTADDASGFLDQLVAEAFRRAGAKARVQVYDASERALLNANSGIDDGFAMRIRGLESQYPNLIRIPEKVIDNDFVAYSRHHDFPTGTWDSLRPYQVAYILGWKVFENNLPPDIKITKVKEAAQLFSLLKLNRTEVILYERWQGLWQARETGMPVKVLEPPLAKTEMFMYLHRKHADLVPKVEKALAGMKRDGSYQRIFNATLKPLAASH